MTTIILASSGNFITINNIDEFLPKKIIDCKIAYIITASKKVNDTRYIDIHKEKMNKLNFSYTEIDIAGQNENKLRKTLNGYDIIIVEWGNTFYLLKTVRKSGFEKVIKELIKKWIVYVGSSAGSYIMCPSIVMATWSKQGFDECWIIDYTGINLVPFLIKAHYKPNMKEELDQISKNTDYPIKIINDKQALLVKDWKFELLNGK